MVDPSTSSTLTGIAESETPKADVTKGDIPTILVVVPSGSSTLIVTGTAESETPKASENTRLIEEAKGKAKERVLKSLSGRFDARIYDLMGIDYDPQTLEGNDLLDYLIYKSGIRGRGEIVRAYLDYRNLEVHSELQKLFIKYGDSLPLAEARVPAPLPFPEEGDYDPELEELPTSPTSQSFPTSTPTPTPTPAPQDFNPEERFASEKRMVQFLNPEFEGMNWEEINKARGLEPEIPEDTVAMTNLNKLLSRDHNHAEIGKENCFICNLNEKLPETLKVTSLMDVIAEKIKNNEIGFAKDANAYIARTFGHPRACTCKSCFSIKMAFKCIGKLTDFGYRLSEGQYVETKELSTIIDLANSLRGRLLEDSDPENIEYLNRVQERNSSVENNQTEASNSTSLIDGPPGTLQNRSSFVKSKDIVKKLFNDKPRASRSYSTYADSRLRIKSSSSNPNHFSEYYHVNNFNNYDFPHLYLLKFFDTVKDLDNHHFVNENIKSLAMDYCILLQIKVNSCGILNSLSNKHCYIISNMIVNNRPGCVFKDIPIYLDSNLYDFILFYSNNINNFTKKIDFVKYGFGLDIVFNYKFISCQEFSTTLILSYNPL